MSWGVRNSLMLGWLGFIVFCCTWSHAQKLPFKTYSIEDGLIQSVVSSIVQDNDGYVWFATRAGVSRFDGLEFKNYTRQNGLPDDLIRHIALDFNGTLWAGTDQGLAYFEAGSFHVPTDVPALASLSVRSITPIKSGGLWVATYEGLYLYESGQLKHYNLDSGLANLRVRHVSVLQNGETWVSSGGGLDRLVGDHFESVSADTLLEGNGVRYVYQDRLGRIWVGTDLNGIFIGENGIFRPFEMTSALGEYTINCILEDSGGTVWIATRESGIIRYKAGIVEVYDRQRGLGNNSIYDIYEDREGNLWFGTFGSGVVRLSSENFLIFDDPHNLGVPNIYDITQDQDGSMWFAANGSGVIRFNKGKYTSITTQDGLTNQNVTSLLQHRDGSIWAGTLFGISIIRDGKVVSEYTTENGIAHNTVISLMQSRDGTVWIGTYGGLTVFRDGTFSNYTSSGGHFKDARITSVFESRDGQIWVGTRTGLYRWRDGLLTEHPLPFDEPPYIFHITQDTLGRILLGTRLGLLRLEEQGLQRFTTEEGLSDNTIKCIAEDLKGNLWLGTNNGINYFDGNKFTVFTYKDGITSNEINPRAVHRDRKGNIWLGTILGITLFDPAIDIQPNLVPPPIYITGFEVLNRDQKLKGPIELEHFQNSMDFRFTGITFRAPEELVYAVQLEGFDKNWQERSERTIQYTSLEPGQYTFKVKARSSDGVWSSAPAELSFTIVPPVWQRAWFILAVLLFISLLAFFIWRDQMRKARLKFQMTTAEAANKAKSRFLAHVSHELRTPLNAIIGYGELLYEDFEDTNEREYAVDMRKILISARQLLALINNLLDITKMESGKMEVYIEQVATSEIVDSVATTIKPLVEKNGNQFSIIYRKTMPTLIHADHPKLRQILLNLLSNASKFTKDGEVRLEMDQIEDAEGSRWNRFIVSDTGIGIAPEKQRHIFGEYQQANFDTASRYGGTGLGLVISQSFCKLMHGKLELKSEPNRGTTFYVMLPADMALSKIEFQEPNPIDDTPSLSAAQKAFDDL